MGLCQSEEEKVGQNKSRQIDKEIKQLQNAEERTVKLLLLGAGECGKSTILKQMRILHNNKYSDDEIEQQKRIVYDNTVSAMQALLRAMAKYNVSFEDSSRESDAKVIADVMKQAKEHEGIHTELKNALINLWNDKEVKMLYESKRLELHLHENSQFFFDNVERIAEKDYKPTDTDILLTRIKTTGIVEVAFIIKKVNFRVFDVGGQRSERKKWIHCFEDVNAIIFIAALSEYDEVLFEDESTNRMIESMRLFESICNSRWFNNTSIILFLNKKDLFLEKIARKNITTAFPEYRGPQTYDDAVKYIKQKFENLSTNPKKNMFVHETCATDTDQVQKILDSVISMIIQQNLHKSGLY
ncbi:unnamed protein product [Caenorhabditis angaria]|uniref:Guanine nucleotide-binding protein alpha-3 subunit n=1 Tax=Caenorhabditis angaria TaxID=860376 RepID=A0A9P1IWQ6_9PELO|nr:unnamed protein product [Caenorhabditis angaria]